jgi:hypothetical protein
MYFFSYLSFLSFNPLFIVCLIFLSQLYGCLTYFFCVVFSLSNVQCIGKQVLKHTASTVLSVAVRGT